jgi:RNA polymerase sigma factor (sigma-70 family)
VEKDLLTRLKSGDAEAFHALLLESQDRVFSICYRFLQNREDAEDTAQEVFVAIHRSLPEFREEADLKTWMHRIAVTKSLDAIRSKRRKKRRDGVRGILLGTESLESIPTTRPRSSRPENAFGFSARPWPPCLESSGPPSSSRGMRASETRKSRRSWE